MSVWKKLVLMNMGAANAAFSFLAMIVIGYVFNWRARDLIWGLWLSSLCLGAFVFVAHFIVWPLIRAKNAVARVKALFGGGFSLVFFTFHYGGFHLIHSFFLSVFFPLEGFSAQEFKIGMYGRIALTYWPAALITVWAQRDLIFALEDASFSTDSVYKYVVKMHLMIFVLAAFTVSKVDSFLVYVVVCVFYFFPFKAFFPSLPDWLSTDLDPADNPGNSGITRRFDEGVARLISHGNAAYDEGNGKTAGKLWKSAIRNIKWAETTSGRRLSDARADVEARLARLTSEQMEKGTLFYQNEKHLEAIAAWETILEYDPENREATQAVQIARLESQKKRCRDKPPNEKC